MIGDDELPRTAQTLGSDDLVGEHAADPHETYEPPEQPADGSAGALLVAFDATGQAGEQRKHQHAQAQAADTEQGKAQCGRHQAPG